MTETHEDNLKAIILLSEENGRIDKKIKELKEKKGNKKVIMTLVENKDRNSKIIAELQRHDETFQKKKVYIDKSSIGMMLLASCLLTCFGAMVFLATFGANVGGVFVVVTICVSTYILFKTLNAKEAFKSWINNASKEELLLMKTLIDTKSRHYLPETLIDEKD